MVPPLPVELQELQVVLGSLCWVVCACFFFSGLLQLLTVSVSCAEAWLHQVPPLPFELQVLEVVLGDVVAMASNGCGFS